MAGEKPILVALIDHDKVFYKKGLSLLRKEKDIRVSISHLPEKVDMTAEDAVAVIEHICTTPPAVLFLSQMVIREALAADLKMIMKLRAMLSHTGIVITYDHLVEETALIAIREGVRGLYHRKPGPSRLVACARRIARGEVWLDAQLVGKAISEYSQLYQHVDSLQPLTQDHKERLAFLSPREIEILRLIAKSSTNADIGKVLFISEKTVKTHIKNIFEKTGVRNRVEAVLLVVRSGLAN